MGSGAASGVGELGGMFLLVDLKCRTVVAGILRENKREVAVDRAANMTSYASALGR